MPADRQQYIHRLGRTGRKGKEGQGILLLAPWEEFFLSNIKDLPINKGSVPSVDPDTTKKVGFSISLFSSRFPRSIQFYPKLNVGIVSNRWNERYPKWR